MEMAAFTLRIALTTWFAIGAVGIWFTIGEERPPISRKTAVKVTALAAVLPIAMWV